MRSYLDKDDPLKVKEIGSESTVEEFIDVMVRVFREVRRVLRPDGVMFLNLGDGYSGSGKGGGGSFAADGMTHAAETKPTLGNGQLLNIPHRVAEALRQDGWIWRQTIIFAKKSPMPESVSGWKWSRCRVKVEAGKSPARNQQPELRRVEGGVELPKVASTFPDGAKHEPCPGCPKCEANGGWVLRRRKGRCTTAFEYIFLMTKSNRYFWDSAGCQEESGGQGGQAANFVRETKDHVIPNQAVAQHRKNREATENTGTRNMRSVWTLSSEPHSLKHFAAFPSELVRRCLSAGVSAAGCCPHCGAPWAPMIDTERIPTRPGKNTKIKVPGSWASGDVAHTAQAWQTELGREEIGNRDPERHIAVTNCVGYRPTCECPEHKPIDSLVCDPFCGIGTVGQTAIKLGNRFIGIDLNKKYLKIAAKRIFEPPCWWLRQQDDKSTVKPLDGQMELF